MQERVIDWEAVVAAILGSGTLASILTAWFKDRQGDRATARAERQRDRAQLLADLQAVVAEQQALVRELRAELTRLRTGAPPPPVTPRS